MVCIGKIFDNLAFYSHGFVLAVANLNSTYNNNMEVLNKLPLIVMREISLVKCFDGMSLNDFL